MNSITKEINVDVLFLVSRAVTNIRQLGTR